MAPRPSLKQERVAWADERLLVGVDEAGRGPLAGPVVAAAVVFPVRCAAVRGLRDSSCFPPESGSAWRSGSASAPSASPSVRPPPARSTA
jgi:hypothetical protein